eukprot:312578-Chlamydomonas_euryale.AAC.1
MENGTQRAAHPVADVDASEKGEETPRAWERARVRCREHSGELRAGVQVQARQVHTCMNGGLIYRSNSDSTKGRLLLGYEACWLARSVGWWIGRGVPESTHLFKLVVGV